MCQLSRIPQPLLLLAVLLLSYVIPHQAIKAPVDCSTIVTVSKEPSMSCNDTSWINETCSNFNNVLSILSRTVLPDYLNCVEVRLRPGRHVLTAVYKMRMNIALRGDSGALVTFDMSKEYLARMNHSGGSPFYVLSFGDANYTEISSIMFYDSPGLIGFDNLLIVWVVQSTFEYFSQGAVDIYNCHTVNVMDSRFTHNGPVHVLKLSAYRGHAGGLSIAYNWENVSIAGRPEVTVSGCYFYNNSASGPSSSMQQSTSTLLKKLVFTGRGGGAAINTNSVLSVFVLVFNSTFEENYALSYGGGIYLAWGRVSGHTVIINHTQFIRNRTPGGAGGLEMGFAKGGSNENAIRVFAYNCEFIENKATHGGGVYFFSSTSRVFDGGVGNFAHFENCLFLRNTALEYAGAVGIILPSANSIFDSRDGITPFEFQNCNFTENDGGRGGAVSMTYFPSKFDGINVFQQNRGRSLVVEHKVIGSRVDVHGHMYFIGNGNASLGGGAMYSTSLGQFNLSNGSQIVFDRNAGNFGAGIVVENLYVPKLFSRLLYNPLCTLILEDQSEPPIQGSSLDINVEFTKNQAVIASAVYTNNLDLCSWSGLSDPFFDRSLAYRWNFINYSNDNTNFAHGSDVHNPLWYIQTEAYSLKVTPDTVSPYAGEVFSLGILALDELGHPTTASFRLTDNGILNLDDSKNNEGFYQFNPAVVSYTDLRNFSVPLSINRLTNESFFHTESVKVETILGQTSLETSFAVLSVGCPHGYILTTNPNDVDTFLCQCDFTDPGIVNCDGTVITIDDGLWAAVSNQSGELSLVTYPCPQEYCQCSLQQQSGVVTCLFMVDGVNPDSQCNCHRKGILCGTCEDGYGVSALLNHCVSCHDANAVLIILLLIADATAFAGLMLVARKLPTWLYPFTFYLQILPYMTEHFPTTFGRFHHPLYYITSALSFYFVYDFCLYHNLSALASYFIRFLPSILSAIVCLVTAFLTYKVTRLFKLATEWYGIWWVILLQYTHVVYTSMSVLNCPTLSDLDGELAARWYVYGDMKCFHGFHAVLALLAIVMLIVCIALIPLMSILALDKIQIANRLVKPLTKAFREEYKWWSGIELGRRLVVVFFVTAFPANNYPAIFIISTIVVIFGFVKPYSDAIVNYTETFLGAIVFVLLLLRNTEQLKEDLKYIPHNEEKISESEGKCVNEVGSAGASTFAWLLAVLYYIPLLATSVGITLWMVYKIRQCHKSRKYKQEQVELSVTNAPTRQPSTTEFNLTTLLTAEQKGQSLETSYSVINE